MFGWLRLRLACTAGTVRGLSLRDVTFTSPAQEWRNTMIFDDVRQLKVRWIYIDLSDWRCAAYPTDQHTRCMDLWYSRPP